MHGELLKQMTTDRDLTIPEVRDSFLEFIENFHAQHSFERDFRILAKELDIKVCSSNQSKAFTRKDGQRVILVDMSTSDNRVAFTGLHEISHHLLRIALDGSLIAYLKEATYDNNDLGVALEEEWCHEVAAMLLMPTHLLKNTVQTYGYSPLAVFQLADCTGASLPAALRRVVESYTIDVHAVLIDNSAKVLSSVAHGVKRKKYPIGYDFRLENSHPLITASHKPMCVEYFEAPIPFKNGQRKWKSKVMSAINHSQNRTLGFFLDSYSHDNTDQLVLDL
jgi:Zn-dependent peptidase ImmA (M78 family)